MGNFVVAAALASLAAAAPAAAQDESSAFTGARVGAELGVIDDDAFGTDSTTYGFIAGYDLIWVALSLASPLAPLTRSITISVFASCR